MIHSSPERNIPDWNESFQTGITYTDVVEKNPYWCYSEMLTFLGSGRGVGAIPWLVLIFLISDSGLSINGTRPGVDKVNVWFKYSR